MVERSSREEAGRGRRAGPRGGHLQLWGRQRLPGWHVVELTAPADAATEDRVPRCPPLPSTHFTVPRGRVLPP